MSGKFGEAPEELEKVASKAMVGIDNRAMNQRMQKIQLELQFDMFKGVLTSLKIYLELLKKVVMRV